jgi:hypothetical protein
MTIEAFADTIIPGEKRFPGDRAIAGASAGPGAVAAGAIELITHSASGFADSIASLAEALNAHARTYAVERRIELDPSVPPFVALAHAHREALVHALTSPGHPEKVLWVGVAMFSIMAFDSAAHLSTPAALAAGHPGLLTIGYAAPDADARWRFPEFSYGRKLADIHPTTTPTGSPA